MTTIAIITIIFREVFSIIKIIVKYFDGKQLISIMDSLKKMQIIAGKINNI